MSKEKTENKDNKDDTFAKISSEAVIKSCKIKPECADLNFDGLSFSARQYEQIADLIKQKDQVLITITLKQPKLPGT